MMGWTTARPRGQALVEFAIVLPVFMLLLFGLVDGGRLVIEYSTLTNAAKAGARVAIVNQSNSAVCSGERTFKCAVEDHAGTIGMEASAVDDLAAPACSGEDCTVTVRLQHTYQLLTPIAASVIGPIPFTVETTMPVERIYTSP